MKKRRALSYLAALAAFAALGIGGATLLCPAGGEENAPLGERDGWVVRKGVPAYAGRTITVTGEQWMQGTLMLCDPAHPLPENYPAPEVRGVRAVAGNFVPAEADVVLRPDAIYALCRIQAERSLHGEAEAVRGAVSYAQQEAEQKEAFARYAAVYPLEEAAVRASAAVPGGRETEHRTGYAVDIALCGPLSLKEENPLCRNETGRWLAEHMWRFGFIQRCVPGSGEAETCENAHLRYVGNIHACAMRALNLGLEDYLALLRREQALTVYDNGAPYASVVCTPENQVVTFEIPENAAPEISGDNAGFVVAAFLWPGNR